MDSSTVLQELWDERDREREEKQKRKHTNLVLFWTMMILSFLSIALIVGGYPSIGCSAYFCVCLPGSIFFCARMRWLDADST
jgi:Flp pilus assembly protein TadB